MTTTGGGGDPAIVKLMKRAALHCEEMSQQVDYTGGEIEALVSAGNAVANAIEKEGSEVREAVRTLTDRLTTAQADLKQAHHKAGSALDHLAARADEVKGETAGLTSAATEGAGQVEEAVGQVLETRNTRATLLRGRFDELAEAMGGFSEAMATQSAESNQVLVDLATDFDLDCGVLAEQKTEWFDGVDRTTTEMKDHADKAVKALGGLLGEHATACLAWGNDVVKDHNLAMEALSAAFAEKPALADLISPEGGLQGVADAAKKVHGEFSASGRAALDRLSNLIPEIVELTASLGPLEGL